MATDPLAMHALLEQLDQDLEAGKNYPDQAAQDHFFQRLITDTQLQNRSKSGQGGLHTSKSLLEVVRYTLRGNKKAQYGPGGSDKKESQDALNHFFTIGSDMLKETYLAKLRAAVQKEAEGTARPARSSVKLSKATNPSAPTPQTTQGNGTERDSIPRATEITTSAEHQILPPNSTVATRNFEPAPGWQTINVPRPASKKRPRSSQEDAESNKRIKTKHTPTKIVVLNIKKEGLPESGLPTNTPRTIPTAQYHPRFPYGLPTPSLSPPPAPVPRTIIYHQPILGCISQAEILEDIKFITSAITTFLGTPQPSSPILATLLGNGTYLPSTPNLSCSSLSHDSIWEWLIENIFSPNLSSTSPFLGILGDESIRRAMATTKGSRVLSADAIVRELALAQLRDPEFVIGNENESECGWTKICQMAWRLKGKMSVSREEFAIVRDREKGCTGLAMKEEKTCVEDDEVEKELSLWRPAV